MSGQPIFYYDLVSPECWLIAERVTEVLGEVPVWQPVLLSGLGGPPPWWETEERAAGMARAEQRARDQGLPGVRWPETWPGDMTNAMLAATFAKQSGRAVAFSLAAFRQQFAAGRNLAETDNVLIAAAACELHPRAVLKALESRTTREELARTTAEAAERGIPELPAMWRG